LSPISEREEAGYSFTAFEVVGVGNLGKELAGKLFGGEAQHLAERTVEAGDAVVEIDLGYTDR
jgi:hypothetical protein